MILPLLLSGLLLAPPAVTPDAAPGLRAELTPMAFLVGHCWRGRFAGTGEDDTHCFEPALGGQHLRDRHRVTGGTHLYEGETLYSWDPEAKAIQYSYYNSLGAVSRGHMRPTATGLRAGDDVYVSAGGKRSRIATEWRRVGDTAFDSVTTSPDLPAMNRTLRYERVEGVATGR